ncbi:MAG: NAD(+) kinase [Cocleimonas sp.]
MQQFSTVGIFSKQKDKRIEDTLKQLYSFLVKENLTIVAEENAAKLLGVEAIDSEAFCNCIDLAIVVGGDGTLLKAGRLLADKNIPVIGINLGRLGFLVDISPQKINTELGKMLKGEYILETRSLLHAEAFREERSLGEGIALNDVVLHVRNDIRMIEFTTHINEHFVNTQRADGIVVATPTGSTAYSLSGGGPILHPGLDAVVLVPICPHTLNNRPIVVNNDSRINISMCEDRNVNARLSFDGQSNIELRAGDHVKIRHKHHKLQLMHPTNYDYFHILRNKLGWSLDFTTL